MTTRREALLALGALALVPACGSSGGGPDSGPAGDAGPCPSTTSTIASNHGHVLDVPVADVLAGAARDYDIQGTAGHTHTVSLSAADFGVLLSTGTVIVTSSAAVHTHMVTVRCA